ncbi:MAG TPA: beta-propeller fold lactonase family protein [Burkholderiales bacterium]
MSAPVLDCRRLPPADAARAIVERFNALEPGARFEALVADYGPPLRVSLLEAGIRHAAELTAERGRRLAIRRGAVPAQGTIPGVHHVVTDGDSVWTCERGERVARIGVGGEPVAVARVARKASHLALEHRSGTLFIADAQGNEVIALHAADLRVIARWRAPGGPQLPLAAPDGVVCVTGGGTGTLTIATPRRGGYSERTVEVGTCPHDPLLDPDAAHVLVPCAGDGELVKVRLADGRIVGRTRVGEGPSHLARRADGRVYCANSWDGTVACVGTEGEIVAAAPSGGWAHAIDVSPDGTRVFVANFLDDTVCVFDAETLERVALIETGPYPHGLDVSPDGRHVVVTAFGGAEIQVLDARTPRELGRVAVGRGSSHTAFCAGMAWVGCSVDDHIACVDLAKLSATRQISIH